MFNKNANFTKKNAARFIPYQKRLTKNLLSIINESLKQCKKFAKSCALNEHNFWIILSSILVKTLYKRLNLFMSDLFLYFVCKYFVLTRWVFSFIWIFSSINSGNELFNNLLGCSWRRILDISFISSYMCNSLTENNLCLHRSSSMLWNLLAENNKRKILLCRHSNFWRSL